MTVLFGAFLLTMLVITAIGIVRAQHLFVSVVLSGIYSLQMAGMFFILDAADVALTEAAVGAGVATVLMLSALALLDDRERSAGLKRLLFAVVASATLILLLHASVDMPSLGDPNAPVHTHVAPWYLEETPRLIGMPNVVTAILAGFRGYDTLGELFVIFTAGTGVLFLLASVHERGGLALLPSPDGTGLRHHLVPRLIGRFVVPFIVLFALYVQFHGDFGPGGGFQAGALASAGIVLYALAEGEATALKVLSFRVLTGMIAAGALLYVGVGLACLLLGGTFLDYSVLADDPIAGQHLGILLVELGVGITVSGVLLAIFHSFAAREQRR